IEAVGGYFFLILALAFVGPGQQLGRALDRLPNRVAAYTINITGSLAGIILFATFSFLQTPPWCWFLPAVVLLAYFLSPATMEGSIPAWCLRLVVLLVVLAAVSLQPGMLKDNAVEQYWSPYYRIDYEPSSRTISVNLIGHQQMVERKAPFPAYALPHL